MRMLLQNQQPSSEQRHSGGALPRGTTKIGLGFRLARLTGRGTYGQRQWSTWGHDCCLRKRIGSTDRGEWIPVAPTRVLLVFVRFYIPLPGRRSTLTSCVMSTPSGPCIHFLTSRFLSCFVFCVTHLIASFKNPTGTTTQSTICLTTICLTTICLTTICLTTDIKHNLFDDTHQA